MRDREPEYALEFLLGFDGRIHHLEEGYWLKFEIKRVEATEMRPHGLAGVLVHAARAGRDAAGGLRQCPPRSAQGFPVQGSTAGERSLASEPD